MCCFGPKKTNKTYNKLCVFIVLVCLAVASFSSPQFVLSHADYCHQRSHSSSYGTMHVNCFVCDCTKKSGVFLRQFNTADRGISFLLYSLILTMALLCAITSLYGLRTLISLKTRMNN